MKGADILVEMLIGYGVETIFGVPGDTNVPFMRPCKAAKTRYSMSWRGTNALPDIWLTPTVVSPTSRGL
ncbi:thiamine pyrophosphate-binding protein [Paracoccus aerius]